MSLAKSIKIHLYWAMKNCGGDPILLKDMIDNIIFHYIVNSIIFVECPYSPLLTYAQGEHTGCFPNSPCHTPAYKAGKNTLSNPLAAKYLGDHLKASYIYRFASSFCRVCHYSLC